MEMKKNPQEKLFGKNKAKNKSQKIILLRIVAVKPVTSTFKLKVKIYNKKS